MEFAPSQIARLVLGYLKAEKCQGAFDAFFNTSPHFSYIANNKQRSKYVVTRVLGYSLKDILNEYTLIYNLIQERLEPTAYYEENSSKNIIDQLTYLLDNGCRTRQNTPQRSMSSTPIKDTNKKFMLQHNLSIIEENVSSELNTTPLEALPGNSQEFNHNITKKRYGLKTNRNTPIEESDSGDSPNNCQEEEEDLEVLRQTLLEHTELHEKIAENINLVINTAESVKPAEEKVCNELDTAIKAIVERTEADPIFEKLIDDLIGPHGDINEKYLEEKVITESDSPQSSGNGLQSSSNIQEGSKNDGDSIKYRLRSPKKHASEKVEENKNVSDEAKVVQTEDLLSVNTNVQTNDNPKQTEIATTDVHKNLTVNTNTGDIVLYEGTLDNYVKTSAPPNMNPTNPIIFNNNLLMVQPGLVQQPAVAAPYYLLNNSQYINVSVPPYKVNNVTEQDILNMPTVIVCDENQQIVSNPTVKSSCTKEQKKILPKKVAEANLREYLTLYQCGDDQDITIAPTKPKPPSKTRKKNPPKTQAIHIEVLKPPDESTTKLPILQDAKQEETDTIEKPSSPRPVTPDPSKQVTRKTTPKSGSHVRALDFNFNTPSHRNLSAKKIKTSSKSPKKSSPSKTSTKISKSLFGSPTKNVKGENGENKTEIKEESKTTITKSKPSKDKMESWDADLRALMGPVKDTSLPRRKRKEAGKRPTKKSKGNLNATETDAKAIEENLRNMDLEVNPNNKEIQVKDEPIIEILPTPIKEEDPKEEPKEEILEEKLNKVENYDNQVSEFTVTIINCNAKSKFKKKCNIDNNISKAVKITKVKEIKSLELVPDGSNKLILSPSKLNANKRTLVENTDKEINLVVSESPDVKASKQKANLKPEIQQDPIDVCDKQDVVDSKVVTVKDENVVVTNEGQKNEKKEETEKEPTKFITPEMPKISIAYPVSANRNLTPMLETPLKYLDTPMKLDELPKTPGLYTPNENSPMTKILNEQLQGVDLLLIETPKFPLTPSFPITPFGSKSSYQHRSTDYSTASSYYQPSDNEQNKSLEAMLEECKRISNKNPSPEKEEAVESSVAVQNSINETICNFNQSQIARKNLSLVREDLESSTSCESNSSDGETSSSSDDSTTSGDSSWNASTSEATVVEKKTENPYMLRPRKKEEITVHQNSTKKAATIQDIVTQTKIKHELDQNTAITAKETILKEVEEKRKRTIAKFKEVEKPPCRKKNPTPAKIQPRRTSAGRLTARNQKKNTNSPGPVITTKTKSTNPVNKRKSKSPVKLPQKPSMEPITEEERNVSLHISSDDDQIKPMDVVETELLESSSSLDHPLNTFQKTLDSLKLNMKTKESNDNISDQEAASLVEGLKERGIYLVPNKTPRKQEKPVRNLNNTEELEGNKRNIPVIPVSEKVKKIKENPLSIETKFTEEKINQVAAKQKDSSDVSDEKSKELFITTKEKKEAVEVVYTPENIKEINTEKIKSDNDKKSTNLNSRKEIDLKEINKKRSTKSKSAPRSNSKDKREQNDKTTNKKIANGAPNTKCNEMPEIKVDMPSCNKEKICKIYTKLNDAVNMSLEEGEILSDDQNKEHVDRSENKRKSVSKISSKSRSREPKRRENKSRNPSRRKSSEKDGDKKSSSRDRAKQKEKTDKLKIKEDKEQTTHANYNQSNISDKVPELQPSTVENQKTHDISVKESIIEHDLNLTDSMCDEVFDDKLYCEETIKLVYDEDKACSKSLKDYDLPTSNKCFVVEVLGQQMEMSITPFQSLLDIPEKRLPDKVRILQNMVISTGNKKSPLSMLYGRLTGSPSNKKTTSPLENLYNENDKKECSHDRVQRIKRNSKRRNSVDQKIFQFKPKVKRNSRSKSLDCSSSKFLLDADEEREHISNAVTKDSELERVPDKNVIKDIFQPASSTKTSPGDIDDELMNYAICGSERVENDVDDKRSNKRKAKDEADDGPFKKTKREDLLKNINVEMFLTQLHGDN